MAQILDPVPSDGSDLILCCYVNVTSKIQVARITNIPDWYFERVVFPGQRLIFEALPKALLEIHTGMMASAILSDTIPCYRLVLETEDDSADGGDPDGLADLPPRSGLGDYVPQADGNSFSAPASSGMDVSSPVAAVAAPPA